MPLSGFDSLNSMLNESDCRLSLTASLESGTYVLYATGELDLSTRHLVEPACPTSGPTNVTVDLAMVTFMDCSGYTGLEVARHRLETIGGTLTVRSARGPVFRLLDLIGIFDALPPERTGPRDTFGQITVGNRVTFESTDDHHPTGSPHRPDGHGEDLALEVVAMVGSDLGQPTMA